ncbi:NAD(P)/FAD-dependent oxidoreductase [Ramlibacter sp.]|uniref:flavin-containing monooxygenase n=1 Tax=Ramlibacter sp. TaxID=1917967 RepID=UPI0026368891|nr:NAD(P)/FAD-dependent oxidoreductase [Ramlibacter sp.]MDB5953822.1 binding domain protein [Ramlibacter sp.]
MCETETRPLEAEVLVVGAGPAGLAVAACLAQAGLRAEIIERNDTVGSSWRKHYSRLRLHTVRQHSALPHLPFPADHPRYVERQQVVDYLARYADKFQLRPWFGEEAECITREHGRWLTRCRSGRAFLTRSVVVATGANGRANRPAFPGEEGYRGRVLHSEAYRDAQPFAGQRVLVVGMGNTGAEIALDLARNGGRATISVRSPVNIVRRDVLGRPVQVTSMLLSHLPHAWADAIAIAFRKLTIGNLRPHGIETPAMSPLRQLREQGRTPVIDIGTVDLVRRGRIAVRPGIAAFTLEGVRFLDGREESFDAVILATGYQAEVQRLFPQAAVPVQDKGLPTPVSGSGALAGVYFVGYDVRQPGGVLHTIGQQARQVTAQIAASRSASEAAPDGVRVAT